MDIQELLPRLASRWWVVAAVTGVAVLGAALALGTRTDQHRSTIHFVLRPNGSVANRDLPGALEELKSDGPLVQTVIGVLGSHEMLRRAAADSGVHLSSEYTVESTARPGSALIDSKLAGPEGVVVDRLASGFNEAASDYVAANYSAYALDRLGADAGGNRTGLSATQLVLVTLLLGVALGVGLVIVELRLEPRLRPLFEKAAARRAAPPPKEHCRATTSKGAPCRNRPVDERGYCRLHGTRIETERSDRSRENGSHRVMRFAQPAVPAPRHRERQTRMRPDEEV
jgi:hypothetical protein